MNKDCPFCNIKLPVPVKHKELFQWHLNDHKAPSENIHPTDRSCNCQYESGHAPTCPLYVERSLEEAVGGSWESEFEELASYNEPALDSGRFHCDICKGRIKIFIQKEKKTSYQRGVKDAFDKVKSTTYKNPKSLEDLEKELLK